MTWTAADSHRLRCEIWITAAILSLFAIYATIDLGKSLRGALGIPVSMFPVFLGMVILQMFVAACMIFRALDSWQEYVRAAKS